MRVRSLLTIRYIALTHVPSLQAKPNFGNAAGTVRFTTYRRHLFHSNERAVISFPHQMQDEIERMFLLMAVLKTEIRRQDVRDIPWCRGVTDIFAERARFSGCFSEHQHRCFSERQHSSSECCNDSGNVGREVMLRSGGIPGLIDCFLRCTCSSALDNANFGCLRGGHNYNRLGPGSFSVGFDSDS